MDYSKVPISREQVRSIFGDASVTLPKGIDRPAHWPDRELPWNGEYGCETEWRRWQADPKRYVPPDKPQE